VTFGHWGPLMGVPMAAMGTLSVLNDAFGTPPS
jgi:hypothetical protein